MLETWQQFGLVGLMVGCMYLGIAWAAKRLLGKDGIIEGQTRAIAAVTACLEKHQVNSTAHAEDCAENNQKVKRLHGAAVVAINEIEAECSVLGLDVTERCNRVRRELNDAD